MSPADARDLTSAADNLDNAILDDFALIKAKRMPEALRLELERVDPAFDRFGEAITNTQRHVDSAASLASTVTIFATVTSVGICILVLAVTTSRNQSRSRRELQARMQAVEDAERANLAKSEFLSRMSHELRTPLNAVIGFAQLLPMQTEDPDILESAGSILKAGRHLLDLVNEVLDLARIEAGKITFSLEPVALRGVITQAVELVLPTAQSLGIAISVATPLDDELHVLADRQRLVQVLINVITNAAKYNRRDGRIEIRCVPLEGERHRIEVQDTGSGIDEQALQRLFVPFERLGNQQAEGTGLGLALSRRLMELMDGELSLLATTNAGSTFAVDLHEAVAPAISTLAIESKPLSTAGKTDTLLRIVYIEDNLSNLQLLERVFEKVGGIEFIPAMLASTGFQLVVDHLPDLVLLDLHLPDAHGIDVLAKLKANKKTADIPVIVLSADATESEIRRLLDAGAMSYLTKPIDLPILFAELEKLKSIRREAA